MIFAWRTYDVLDPSYTWISGGASRRDRCKRRSSMYTPDMMRGHYGSGEYNFADGMTNGFGMRSTRTVPETCIDTRT